VGIYSTLHWIPISKRVNGSHSFFNTTNGLNDGVLDGVGVIVGVIVGVGVKVGVGVIVGVGVGVGVGVEVGQVVDAGKYCGVIPWDGFV
jgi:hypothetical protein